MGNASAMFPHNPLAHADDLHTLDTHPLPPFAPHLLPCLSQLLVSVEPQQGFYTRPFPTKSASWKIQLQLL